MALAAVLDDFVGFRYEWCRSCDYSAPQQRFLCRYSHEMEDSGSCVLNDINDRRFIKTS